jgi:hypothetical protein
VAALAELKSDELDYFRDQSLVADPYPYFDRMRDECPVQREPHHDVVMVTGYDEAVAVFSDPKTFSSCNALSGPFPGFPVPLEGDDVSELIEAHRNQLPMSDEITTMDPPRHAAYRSLVARYFTPNGSLEPPLTWARTSDFWRLHRKSAEAPQRNSSDLGKRFPSGRNGGLPELEALQRTYYVAYPLH